VLVVVLGRDPIARLEFSLGQRQVPVIISSRVVRALWRDAHSMPTQQVRWNGWRRRSVSLEIGANAGEDTGRLHLSRYTGPKYRDPRYRGREIATSKLSAAPSSLIAVLGEASAAILPEQYSP
jgi:hypothetical protein